MQYSIKNSVEILERTPAVLQASQARLRFARFAQFEESKGKSLQQLPDEFAAIHIENMTWFKALT